MFVFVFGLVPMCVCIIKHGCQAGMVVLVAVARVISVVFIFSLFLSFSLCVSVVLTFGGVGVMVTVWYGSERLW